MQPLRLNLAENAYVFAGRGLGGDLRLWIDGMSGRVSLDGRVWKTAGYLTNTPDVVVSRVKKGMRYADVEALLGETSKKSEYNDVRWYYLCASARSVVVKFNPETMTVEDVRSGRWGFK